jgi:hypothetical protein
MNRWKKFLYRFKSFEFWPFDLFYFPLYFYYAYLVVKYRSFWFFTSANPGIEFGGFLGEKKSDIYAKIPSSYLPITRKYPPDISLKNLLKDLQGLSLSFPVICKPNVGERGWMVELIEDEKALEKYLQRIPLPFLVQEFIDLPLELGVFWAKKPGTPGMVTSIVQKQFLQVEGNGKDSVYTLLASNPRAVLQFQFTSAFHHQLIQYVPSKGETVKVEPIGNHCRGTTFLDACHEIDPAIHQVFNQISAQIDGFYFGRYDLKCTSFEDLRAGKNIKILELNGAGSEPGHIYQPGRSIWKAYRDTIWHLDLLGQISHINRKKGYRYYPFIQGLKKMKEIRQQEKLRK